MDNMSINGYMMTPLFSTTVYDGKKSIDDITIMSSDLEANGIDENGIFSGKSVGML